MSGLVRRLLTLPLLAALVGIGLVLPTAAPAYAASTPTGLKAVAVSSNAVALTWSRVRGADAYRVQFSKSSSMKSAKTVDVDTTNVEWTYLNPEPSANSGRLQPNTTYYFRVKVITKVDLAHSAKSLSKYGAKLKVRTSGTGSHTYLKPMKLEATTRSATSEYVSWNSRGPGIQYRVRYGMGGNTETKVFDYAGGVLTGLTAGATYSYSVEVISRANDATLSPTSEAKPFTPASTAHPAIKIASYNICGNACGNWAGREKGMLDSLHRQAPDLIATQESTNSDNLINDYNALANRNFERIANYKHAGLAFDAARFSLVASGIHTWTADPKRDKDAVWAILADKSDGDRKLLVVSVHFTNNSASVRKSEAVELAQLIDQHQGLPVVVAGDFNVSKRKSDHPAVYSTVSQAGLVDPLGNPSDSRYVSGSATVEHRIDVGYASANQFQRHALRSKWENGYDVDYIWHSKGVRAAMFQVVVDLDGNGNFMGTMPSDHNMLVSSFHLS